MVKPGGSKRGKLVPIASGLHRKVLPTLLESLDPLHRGVEIGLWQGQTSRILLDRFPELHMVGIDPYYFKKFMKTTSVLNEAAMMKKLGNDPRFQFIRKSSKDAVIEFPDDSFDFVFIDGGHRYGTVKTDLEIWWPKVRDGGIFCGHDYEIPQHPFEVKRAVDEFFDSMGKTIEVHPGYIWLHRK